MITTKNCCCCISLRAGCLIIGWIQFIFPVLGIIFFLTGVGSASGSTNGESEWGGIVTNVLQLIISVCLLYGVYKNLRSYVRFYVIVEATLLVLIVIIMVAILIAGGFTEVVPAIISVLIIVGVSLYLLIVVNSFYLEMETMTVNKV